jgi:anti-sigma regulatory factor (Ser/Thr protein kinase)
MPYDTPAEPYDGPAEPYEGLDQGFDRDSLVSLRSAVAAHGDRLGVNGDRLSDLLLIAHELASNAIIHGGGRGRLRLWGGDGRVHCRVEDRGGGFAASAAEAGRQTPAIGAANGRGLWLVRQLADHVEIDTDARGTSITAVLEI